MAARKRFYVYRIFDADNQTLYVGKGSGRRLQHQKRNHAADGEIIAEFGSEAAAYKHEIRAIAELKPVRNVLKGGNGPWVRKPIPRRTRDEIEMQRLGTRVYAARQLLRFDLRAYLSASKIEAIRQAAYG